MTRGSIEEYTEAVRGRYLKATKKEKGRILDEFIQVSGGGIETHAWTRDTTPERPSYV